MRWETQAEPAKGQERAGYLWTVSKPRYHPVLSLASLNEPGILYGLCTLSGLSVWWKACVLHKGVQLKAPGAPIATACALTWAESVGKLERLVLTGKVRKAHAKPTTSYYIYKLYA